MKKLILFPLFGVLIASFISCNSDENDDGTDLEFTLEGTLWIFTDRIASGCDNPDDNETLTNASCTESDCETISLNNGIITIVDKEAGVSEITTAMYTISGNIVTITFEEEGVTTEFDVTYSIQANILTIMFTFPFDGCDVVETYKAME
ncbi:hypothetical protein [Ekhidna sp.]|uniref:hypothetical protein n=1 Tax=Ekhidna sp. TaxID=2608089 RepID=UPI0032EE296C